MNVTKMYINYLPDSEKAKITDYLRFLTTNDELSKKTFAAIASKIYAISNRLEILCNNGNTPYEYRSNSYSQSFYTIVQFEQKDLTEDAINALGKRDGFDWRYFYSISICKEDRKLYLVSFSNKYSPNWNKEYNAQRVIPFDNFDFPIIKKGCKIYRMDDALHAAINEEIYRGENIFHASEGDVRMTVKDQHGNFCEITGSSLDEVFRDYADNYTGYRNYRRQMASEWEIVSDVAKEMYQNWFKTAKNLKSDFAKFYGGSIVD